MNSWGFQGILVYILELCFRLLSKWHKIVWSDSQGCPEPQRPWEVPCVALFSWGTSTVHWTHVQAAKVSGSSSPWQCLVRNFARGRQTVGNGVWLKAWELDSYFYREMWEKKNCTNVPENSANSLPVRWPQWDIHIDLVTRKVAKL